MILFWLGTIRTHMAMISGQNISISDSAQINTKKHIALTKVNKYCHHTQSSNQIQLFKPYYNQFLWTVRRRPDLICIVSFFVTKYVSRVVEVQRREDYRTRNNHFRPHRSQPLRTIKLYSMKLKFIMIHLKINIHQVRLIALIVTLQTLIMI